MAALKGPGTPSSTTVIYHVPTLALSNESPGSGLRICIVHARWNTTIIEALVKGARKSMLAAGVKPENIHIESVPGSYELPFAVQKVYAASQIQSTSATSSGGLGSLTSGIGDLLGGGESQTDLHGSLQPTAPEKEDNGFKHAFDAVLPIGVLINGESKHFKYISDAVTHGLMRVSLDTGVPVIFGLLTVLNEEQALARAGLHGGTGEQAKGHNHGEDWGLLLLSLA